MPIIRISCLPKETEERLNQIHKAVVAAVESVTALGLKGQNSMTVLFPADSMSYGLGEEIIIEVFGLFNKPERDENVRAKLAEKLGTALCELYPNAVVECFINLFDPRQGFWASNMFALQPATLDELFQQIPQGYFSPGTNKLEARGIHEIIRRIDRLWKGYTLEALEARLHDSNIAATVVEAIVMTIADNNGLKPCPEGGWEADK